MAGEQFSPAFKMGVRQARDWSREVKFHGEGSVFEALPERSLNAVYGLIDKGLRYHGHTYAFTLFFVLFTMRPAFTRCIDFD